MPRAHTLHTTKTEFKESNHYVHGSQLKHEKIRPLGTPLGSEPCILMVSGIQTLQLQWQPSPTLVASAYPELLVPHVLLFSVAVLLPYPLHPFLLSSQLS